MQRVLRARGSTALNRTYSRTTPRVPSYNLYRNVLEQLISLSLSLAVIYALDMLCYKILSLTHLSIHRHIWLKTIVSSMLSRATIYRSSTKARSTRRAFVPVHFCGFSCAALDFALNFSRLRFLEPLAPVQVQEAHA